MRVTAIRTASVVLLLSLTCGLSIYYLRKGAGLAATSATTVRKPAGASAKLRAARPVVAGDVAWQEGVRHVYDVDLGTTLKRKTGAPDPGVLFEGSAKLELTPEHVTAEHMTLQGKMRDVSISTSESEQQHAVDASLRSAGDRTFIVEVDATGAIESIAVDRDADSFTHSLIRQALAALQFIEPAQKGANEWTATESDAIGIYRAHYQRTAPGEFTRTKLEYVQYTAAGEMAPGHGARKPRVRSTTTFKRSGSRVTVEARLREAVIINIEQLELNTESYANLVLNERGPVQLAVVDRTRLQTEAPQARAAVGSPRQSDEEKLKLIDGRTLGQMLTELARLPDNKDNAQQRAAFLFNLSALFDLDPSAVEDAVAQLRGELGRGDADILLGALSGSSSVEASEALARLAGDPSVDPRVRGAATMHLGLSEHPTAGTFERLNEMVRGESDPALRGAATLAMGGAARHAQNGDDATRAAADDAVRDLSERANGARTPENARTYINALGNSGSSRALDAIQRALASPDDAVRAAAVLALRFVPDAAADALLIRAIGTDPSPEVRATAVEAAGYRPANAALMDACAKALRTDPETRVRLAVLQLFKDRLQQLPSLRPAIEWVAQNDASEDVRSAAARALGGRSARG